LFGAIQHARAGEPDTLPQARQGAVTRLSMEVHFWDPFDVTQACNWTSWK